LAPRFLAAEGKKEDGRWYRKYPENSLKQGIKKKTQIANIFKNAKIYNSPLFKIYYLKTNESTTHIVPAVSKKICCAVKRNRIKRVLREVFRKNDIKSFDVIVKVKKFDDNFRKISQEIEKFIGFVSIEDTIDRPH